MKIKGREYEIFKADELSLLNLCNAQRTHRNLNKLTEQLLDDEKITDEERVKTWERMRKDWREFILSAFKNPDNEIQELNNIPGMEAVETRTNFFTESGMMKKS